MDRRNFLKTSLLGGLSAASIPILSPELGLWAYGDSPKNTLQSSSKILVLIELKGGNDGLNTLIPYADDRYYNWRPKISIAAKQVLKLNTELGLHPKLAPMLPAWESGELAIVNGIGYADPNRSHFRSIDIWETGSDSDEFRQQGWIAESFNNMKRNAKRAADAVVLNGGLGPLAGPGMRIVAFDDPKRFAKQARRVRPLVAKSSNAALNHLLATRTQLLEAARIVEKQHGQVPSQKQHFSNQRFGKQLQTAAELIIGEVPIQVLKLVHGGFDTHSNQQPTHDRLMADLGKGLAAFRKVLTRHQRWEDVLVMTYSEFGRRPAENGSGGTDHGTAAPHFIMGAKVKGGLYGEQPSLGKLVQNDLVHTVDYRRLYETVRQRWWLLPTSDQQQPAHNPLPFLASRKRL